MAIRFDEIELSASNHTYYPVLSHGGNGLKITTSTGHGDFGSGNSSYFHISTDRGTFYFSKPLSINGNIASYGGGHTATFATYYDSNNTNYYVNPESGSVLGGTINVHADSDSSLSIINAGTNAIGIYAHAGDELYLGSNNQGTVRLHQGGTMELTVADTFYKYDGDKYARGFKNYQYYAGGGSYYGSGNHGWTKIATVTVTSNCAGANLFGKLYQRNYHDVAIINVAFVIRSECDFTSNNESHFVENASTFAATSYHTDIDSSVRAVLIASSSNSRTYEVQFYEFAWNDNWYELWTTGWTILDTPAAPTASTGTARLNNNSYGAAKVYYGTSSVRSPIFYDLNDTNYYCDPNGQSRLNTLNLGSSPTSGITSGYIAQIRGHMHMTGNNIDSVNRIKLNEWLRFQTSTTGIFWNGTGHHIYPANANNHLRIRSGHSTANYVSLSCANETPVGYLYGEVGGSSAHEIGLLDSDGHWAIQHINSGNTTFKSNNVTKFTVGSNGTVTATGDVVAYSDERLKTDIETLDGSKVYEMRGVSFTKDEKDGSGVIAQELEKVAPELVNNDGEYKSVAYGNITGYLIEAIKDLKKEIEECKKQKCNCNGSTN